MALSLSMRAGAYRGATGRSRSARFRDSLSECAPRAGPGRVKEQIRWLSLNQGPMLVSSTEMQRRPVGLTRRRLEEGRLYWLATVRSDARPHVMRVLAVWLDGALYFVAGSRSRKARNLALNPECVVTIEVDDAHLAIEGPAATLRDEATLHRIARAYACNYGWSVRVQDTTFVGDGAPTAGPPPYDVYELAPATIFAFGTQQRSVRPRWCFRAGHPHPTQNDPNSEMTHW